MTEYHIANTSYLIALYRLNLLDAFFMDKQVYITERIYSELVEKPLSKIQQIKINSLRKKILQSINKFKTLTEQKKLLIHSIEYSKMSKLLELYRHKIAKLEKKKIDDVKTDHTIIALAVQLATKGHKIFFYSLDKAINSILSEEIKQKNLKISIIDTL